MSYKDILKVVPTIQAANMLDRMTKKKKKKSLIGDATDIFVGIPLIQAESDLIGGL